MVAVTTYTSKGGSVSTTEADANFTNLNTGKVEDALSFPSIRPSLMLDFVNGQTLDPRITFTRTSTATFVGSNGLIQTAAANVPRFDFDPVTLACRGLLLEEQRTNLASWSQDFSNWTNQASGLTIVANAGIAPDGTNTAQKLVEDEFSSHHRRGLGGTGGTARRFSIFAKAAERTLARGWSFSGGDTSGQLFDLASGTCSGSLNPTITPFGNGWYRCSFDVPSANDAIVFGPRPASEVGTTPYTGTLGWGILVWGGQIESGSFATSYIPTAGSQVTRSADSASMTGTNFSSWYGLGQGTYVIQASSQQTGGVLQSFFQDGNITLATNGGGNMNVFNGSTYFGIATQVTGINATTFAAAVAYTSGTGASGFSVNGAAASSFTNPGLAPQASFGIGTAVTGGGSGARGINGYIRKLEHYPRRLTNAQLQALTTI